MASLTIDHLEDGLLSRLRSRGDAHGTSIEEEAATILKDAIGRNPPATGRDFVASIRSKFEPLGGVDLDIPPREASREPPSFE